MAKIAEGIAAGEKGSFRRAKAPEIVSNATAASKLFAGDVFILMRPAMPSFVLQNFQDFGLQASFFWQRGEEKDTTGHILPVDRIL